MGRKLELDTNVFWKIYRIEKSLERVAKQLNCGVDAVNSWMKRNNIEAQYKRKYTQDDNFFGADNEQSFYWAGFIAADGYIYSKRNALKISLASKDRNHIEKFRLDIKSTNKISDYEKSSEISIYSKQICQDLKRFNIVQKKSLIYAMPEWLIEHPLVHHFLRGYMDGDGSYSKSKSKNRKAFQFHLSILGTFKFVNQFMMLLDRKCNFNYGPRKIKINGKISYAGFSGNKRLKNIVCLLYKNANIYLDRKYNIIKHFLEIESKI